MKQTDSSQQSSKNKSTNQHKESTNKIESASILQSVRKMIGPFSVRNSKFMLTIIGIFLVFWFVVGTILHDTSNKKVARDIKPVRVQVVESKAIVKTTYYTLQGTLEALNKVKLKAETSGSVQSIVADKGQKIYSGDTILNLSFDSRLSKLREAQALVSQRRLEYENAKKLQSGKFRSKTEVANSRSQLESAQANLEQIQEDIEDTKIRAPFNGVVDNRFVEIGDYVAIGDPLVDFVSLDPLLGVVNVAEKDIHLIKVGAECLIDCKGSCRTGRVTFKSSIADPDTRTYKVEIQVDNPRGDIPDGITASIHIPIETSPAHLFSPAAIAMDDEGRPGIKIVNKENVVEFYNIDILNHDQTGVWVRGLPEHVRIITVGQFFIRTGDKVEPVVINNKYQPQMNEIEKTIQNIKKDVKEATKDEMSKNQSDATVQDMPRDEAPEQSETGSKPSSSVKDASYPESSEQNPTQDEGR